MVLWQCKQRKRIGCDDRGRSQSNVGSPDKNVGRI